MNPPDATRSTPRRSGTPGRPGTPGTAERGADRLADPVFAERYRAMSSRDARFDGQFFTGVHTTGIYCRPSCPAATPRPGNVSFYLTSAAAHEAGLRACKRCLPDAVPGSPDWNTRDDLAARAMRLIDDGTVERDGVPGLARRLGYTPRHLTRVLVAELGAGPLALARAHRAQTARLLLLGTALPISEVAFAAGFGSVRQFNDTIRATFSAPPSELRARSGRAATMPHDAAIGMRLAVRQPFDRIGLAGFLAARAVSGVETVDHLTVTRALSLPGGPAVAELALAVDHVDARFHLTDLADLAAAIARCRRLLDLDADPEAVDATLGGAPSLAASVGTHPGRRVPGAVDGWELAARAVVGQQVSVAGARAVLGRIVAAHGAMLADPVGLVTLEFPDAATVAALDPAALPLPEARARALVDLAAEVASGRLVLDAGADRDEAAAGLRCVRGIGRWTADYVRMRALGDPDVLLDGDLVIHRQLQARGVDRDETEPWRPWRSYASMHLWALSTEPPPTNGVTP